MHEGERFFRGLRGAGILCRGWVQHPSSSLGPERRRKRREEERFGFDRRACPLDD